MREKRQEIPVNLVRYEGDETYRIVSDRDMLLLKAHSKVIFEKSRIARGMVGSFYIQVEK